VTIAPRGNAPHMIPLVDIDEPQLPSRTEMDETEMVRLIESIRTTGFWSTLVVVPDGLRFRVVAGHRRTIAARRVGLIQVPCFIFDEESAALEWIQHAENQKREALTVTDEAIWFAQLLEKYPEDGTDGLAARVGETRAYVEGRLLLLQGCERVFDALRQHTINIGVAMELNKITEPAHRFMCLDQAATGGATVTLVKRWVQEWRTIHAPAGAAVPPPAPVADSSPLVLDDYFTCRVCGERDQVHAMRPLNAHDFCWRTLLDPKTGLVRAKTDYVLFPRTRDEAVKLVDRLLERFPELVPDPAAQP